jgi:hypothetical protein
VRSGRASSAEFINDEAIDLCRRQLLPVESICDFPFPCFFLRGDISSFNFFFLKCYSSHSFFF